MTPEESREVYESVRSEIDNKLSIFPYNFSMSDGLLYLGHSDDEKSEAVMRSTHSEVV